MFDLPPAPPKGDIPAIIERLKHEHIVQPHLTFSQALVAGLPVAVSGSKTHQIPRSLRCNPADTPYLSRTPSSAGNRKILAFRIRIKRCGFGTKQVIASAGTTSIDAFYFDTSDRLCLDVLGTTRLVTTRVFRDPTAWLDIGFELDVGNGTDALRAKILIEDAEATAYSTDTRSSITDTDTNWNNTVVHYIGRDNGGNYLNAYISEPSLVDGSKSIRYSVATKKFNTIIPVKPFATWGTNGFYLPLSDNSNTTSSTLGKDRSGNDNDFTPNNFSVASGVGNDSLTDTPTNWGTDTGVGGEVLGNYCTLNPLDKDRNHGTLADGNLDWSTLFSDNYALIRGTIGINTGKFGFEVTNYVAAGSNNSWAAGWTKDTSDLVGKVLTGSPNIPFVGAECTFPSGSTIDKFSDNTTAVAITGSSWVTGATLQVLIDATNGKYWIGQGGNYYNATNSLTTFDENSPTGTFTPGNTYFPLVQVAASADNVNRSGVRVNFGQRPFENALPTGFKALCTQNRPDPTIKNPSKGFVATTESGANIQTALAALRSGWTDYIEIFKRTDSTEGWRWRFSDDPSNYLDSSSQNAKAAFPALSGTSYVGYAIRCDAGYPARTGEVSHTNGSATTIMHNLGNARCLIGVKNSGTGSTDWWVYHPDAASGELLKLNGTDADAANTTITSVGANSFQIGSAAATGTYRWFIIAETDGFFSLGKYTGNANADGPFVWASGLPDMFFRKRIDSAIDGAWLILDAARDPTNPNSNYLFFNGTDAAGTTDLADFVANGVKTRTSGGGNASGGVYVYAAFAKTAFKYARAA